jgi:phospholipase D-like protein
MLVLTPTTTPDRGVSVQRRRWADLSPHQQTAVLVATAVQLSLTVTAWADLATRTPAEVNGSRTTWAAVIAVNVVGPLAWFRWGRRTQGVAQ